MVRLPSLPVPAGFLVVALLGSCATVTRVPVEDLPSGLTGPALAMAEPGSVAYELEAGSRQGVFGCTVAYETYRPTERASDLMVMLAHGFAGNLSAMRGWAAHWASHGITATVVSFCNSTWTNGHHDRNAADLVALARSLHQGPVLYGGFSAGGLAAFLAASEDDRAVAYLGLDAVDSGGLAAPAAARFRLPALFLVGDPSSCNARNNFLPAIPVGDDVTVLRVLRSTHCHFQNPYDPRCEIICGSVRPREAADETVRTIRSLATAWVLERATADPEAVAVLAAARRAEGTWAGRVGVGRSWTHGEGAVSSLPP